MSDPGNDHHHGAVDLRRIQRWEVAWADMMPEEQDEEGSRGWVLTPGGQQLLAEGWEPFAMTTQSVYHPEGDNPLDIFRERMWFRRPT